MNPRPDSDGTLKVLLIEDDEDDALITRSLLEKLSNPLVALEWVPSYDEGLEQIKSQQHDIGLLDYQLGSRTGLELLQEANSHGLHFPLIMLTGQGNESLVIDALELGAIDYLPKRIISSESLQRAICHGIEKNRLQAAVSAHQRELEKTNQELERKNEEIQRFYHVVAHELKTPLTAASEFVEILLEGIPGPLTNTQEEYLQLIHRCCDHLDRNINDLYDITRLETGKLSIHPQLGSLPGLIDDVVKVFTSQVQAKDIDLNVRVAPDLPFLHFDPQRIRQVLLNLLGNALKFTPKRGKIIVSACDDSPCGGRMRVSIEDTGVGIAQDQLEHIFERLYQVKDDSPASASGLGLGLFICREIIKLHGGTMMATSDLGKGSIFSFTLPYQST
ncbi:MAG: hybrid sensor histidine kinase/response regulator [Nitrospira sp.]|nr:hybrid sensor histidine kinase/response regulator [Nitrospira sp.]